MICPKRRGFVNGMSLRDEKYPDNMTEIEVVDAASFYRLAYTEQVLRKALTDIIKHMNIVVSEDMNQHSATYRIAKEALKYEKGESN